MIMLENVGAEHVFSAVLRAALAGVFGGVRRGWFPTSHHKVAKSISRHVFSGCFRRLFRQCMLPLGGGGIGGRPGGGPRC